MGLVTVFCPLTTTGEGKFVFQTAGGKRFVADCKMKPLALVGHVKITLVPESMMVSCGRMKILNSVPPELPPLLAVPYSILPDKIKPDRGIAPSLFVISLGKSPEPAVKS